MQALQCSRIYVRAVLPDAPCRDRLDPWKAALERVCRYTIHKTVVDSINRACAASAAIFAGLGSSEDAALDRGLLAPISQGGYIWSSLWPSNFRELLYGSIPGSSPMV